MFRVFSHASCMLRAAVLALPSAVLLAQTGTPSSPDPSQTPASQVPATQAPAPPPSRSQSPVAVSRSRRLSTSRQARIERNIRDAYSHRWEVAGGGGYLRFRPGQYLQKNSEVDFFSSATRMWNPQWGVLVDLQGSYGAAKIPNLFSRNNVFRPNISEYNFTAGVQYRYLGTEKYSVSFAGTGGVTLSKFGGDAKGLPSQDLGLYQDSDYNPTFTFSVNLDYNIYNNLAFRVQPKYVGTTFGSSLQNNLGVNGGLVYRFGRQ